MSEWASLPRIGQEDADHATVLDGGAFSDLGAIPAPVGVQEVYIMDNFMRALAEFRSRQREDQVTVPIPCHCDEPLEHVKRRLFEQVRANLEFLKSAPPGSFAGRYGEGCSGAIREYKWAKTFFGEGWSEADLKWFVYQRYEDFCDPGMWRFYGPDLARPTELYDELRVFRAKDAVAKFKAAHKLEETAPGAAPSTSKDAIYLLPTHVRVMLWREGYEMLMYTLPRNTTFEALKALVEADVGEPGKFTKFDVGTPGARFGPGKRLEDVVAATTVGVSHAWA